MISQARTSPNSLERLALFANNFAGLTVCSHIVSDLPYHISYVSHACVQALSRWREWVPFFCVHRVLRILPPYVFCLLFWWKVCEQIRALRSIIKASHALLSMFVRLALELSISDVSN